MNPLGLLLATMERPPAIEEEFQDWYDAEHFPERRDCDGFLTAGRYICRDGWPKYSALFIALVELRTARIGETGSVGAFGGSARYIDGERMRSVRTTRGGHLRRKVTFPIRQQRRQTRHLFL
jgi:hypothetical protein